MLEEVLLYLDVKKDAWFIDCNLGGGGHTGAILERGGRVVGIDLDPDAIAQVTKEYPQEISSKRLVLVQTNFINVDQVIGNLGIGPVAGVLFDLGVSTYQLETPQRGFSFNLDAPLDMRMDKSSRVTATDLVNGLHEDELAQLFWKLGEERFSRQIAKKIVDARKMKKIETTDQLAQVILSVRKRGKSDRTHPATRVFQALRIAVNDELNSLKTALPKAFEILSLRGRLVVISFHSLEDRIVKDFFKSQAEMGSAKLLTKKPVLPSEEEVQKNPRSRSGKLRAIEKL